ncbi:Oxidoreductase, short-chain dehydrogenase/reductase family [Cupriavidus sp. U2]|uniref:SDR family NAD(P)-dependent oxidoreductase n=1 Tax=Cupriavidus sp. U2 TaxID=2920269 RepID=UPI00129D2BC2|nr:SDR family NAD(P)-dependent oxidoreductase [Cupriavidus sp. U2]KAI3590493.1 Oxidoreductase, short-chain dehydrogenase/reductase family [Cupriavidus sp. U2]
MTNRGPRNIVITGASAGIGQALAHAYAAPGVALGLVARDPARLAACANQCRKAGAVVEAAQLDVRDSASMGAWLTSFDDTHPIDLLIANAGVASTLATACDWEDLQRTQHVFDTNFYGAMHALLPVVERMRERKRGHVAMISSLAALRGMAISPAYCASKSAIKAYGESVRPLLARDGIKLSLVFPGFVKTAMSDVFPGDKRMLWSAEKAAKHIRAKLASGRSEIAFPSLLAIGMGLLPLLPARLGDAILDLMSYVPREER